MSEWIINNTYKKTKEGFEHLGLMNTHTGLDQSIMGQLYAISEYLVKNGITKFNCGEGIWITGSQLQKEKKQFILDLLEYWEKGDDE